MPKVTRGRAIRAAPDQVWRVVSDPHHLPRWWPGVERVEDASPEAWTEVLVSSKGKAVRADYSRVESQPQRRLAWRQEVEASPFERFLAGSLTELTVEPLGDREVRVELRATRRLRGLARLGGPMVRRATARQLAEALEGLDAAVGAGPGEDAS